VAKINTVKNLMENSFLKNGFSSSCTRLLIEIEGIKDLFLGTDELEGSIFEGIFFLFLNLKRHVSLELMKFPDGKFQEILKSICVTLEKTSYIPREDGAKNWIFCVVFVVRFLLPIA
jgi:hypothetical protein